MNSNPNSIQPHSIHPSITNPQSESDSNHPQSAHPRIFEANLLKPQSTLLSFQDSVSIISKHASIGWNHLTRRAKEVVSISNDSQSASNHNHSTPQQQQLHPSALTSKGGFNGDFHYDSFSNQGFQSNSTSSGLGGENDSSLSAANGNVGVNHSLQQHLSDSKQHEINSSSTILEKVTWSNWIHLPNSILHSISSSSSDASGYQKDSRLSKGKTLCLFLSYPINGLHIYSLEGDKLKELVSLRDLKDENGERLGRVLGVEMVRNGVFDGMEMVKDQMENASESRDHGKMEEIVNETRESSAVDGIVEETITTAAEATSASNGNASKKKKRKEKSQVNAEVEGTPKVEISEVAAESTDSETSSSGPSSTNTSQDSNFTPLKSNSRVKTQSKDERIKVPEDSSLEFSTPHLLLITSSSTKDESNLQISRYSLISNKVFFTIPLSQVSFPSTSNHFNSHQSITLKKSSRFLVVSQSFPPAIHVLSIKTLKPLREPLLDVENVGGISKDGFIKPPTFDLRDRILCYVSNGLEADNSSSRNGNGNEVKVMIGPKSSAFKENSNESLDNSSSANSDHPHRYSNINSQQGNLSTATNHALNAGDYARKMSGNLVNGIMSKNFGLADWGNGRKGNENGNATPDRNLSTSAPMKEFGDSFGISNDSFENNKRSSFGGIRTVGTSSSSSFSSSPSSQETSNRNQVPASNSTSSRSRGQTSLVKLIDLVSSTSSDSNSSKSSSPPISTILSFNPSLSSVNSSNSPAISVVSLAPSAAGAMLLLTADEDGRKADVWEWRNCGGKNGNGRGSIWHRYRVSSCDLRTLCSRPI